MKYRWPRMRVRIELPLLFLGMFGSFLTIGRVISRYTDAVDRAKVAQLGIWTGDVQEPWEWRKAN